MTDKKKKLPEPAAPAAPKPRVLYGFSCGAGPCRVFSVIENPPQPPAVKALPKLPDASKPK